MENGKWIDLHAHTSCSDGSMTPTEVVELAAQRGLAAVAITDHDTTEGIKEAMEAGHRLGIEVIPGIEFSTMQEGFDVHMVGLFVDPDDPGLQCALETIVENRRKRNERMVQNLRNAGLDLTPGDVATLGDGIWTRGSLAGLLVEKGYASSVKDGMERYLLKGKPGYEPKVAPTPAEATEVLHQAGALSFVAHFHQIVRKDLDASMEICRHILEAGADGLETRYSEFDEKMQQMAEKTAEEFQCLRSGGSDFHGQLKPGLELGTGYEDLRVPYDYLEAMKQFRK